MKKIFSTIAAVLLASTTLMAAVQQADSTEIRQLLEQRDREVKELLGPEGTEYTDQQREQLKNMINGIMDYRAMSRYALQESYDTLSVEEQQRFVDLFSTIVRDQSLSKLDIYRAEVTYNSIEVTGDSAIVNTLAVFDNVRTQVVYDMQYKKDSGEWVITDMVLDGLSTAESYRQSFQRIIRQRGYAYLVDVLEERVAG